MLPHEAQAGLLGLAPTSAQYESNSLRQMPRSRSVRVVETLELAPAATSAARGAARAARRLERGQRRREVGDAAARVGD